jgi:DNA (cytosine-5)-methyltransferase 1
MARRKGRPFTFSDMFAGIGGFRLGLESVGGRCVYAAERDKSCRRTYAEWFGHAPQGGEMAEVKAEHVPTHDIMTAGWPCQPFSRAGLRRGFSDPRGNCFCMLAKILLKLGERRPKAVIFENVKNIVAHGDGKTFAEIVETLERLEYGVHCTLLDAQDFGVPQCRERAFIVGFDLSRMARPKSFKVRPPTLPHKPRVADILEDDPPDYTFLDDHLWRYLQDRKAKMRKKGHGFGFGLADLNGVARTLNARYYKDGAEILIPRKGKNPRRLSPREAARLMGFPDSVPLPIAIRSEKGDGSWRMSRTQAYRQFGNAVVPAVVAAVGRQVVYHLNSCRLL